MQQIFDTQITSIENTKSYNLKDAVKTRFKQYINQLMNDHNITQLILVVDQYSLKLISNLFKIPQLISIGIIIIQKLQLIRKIQQQLQALYIIQPKQQSINLVISDYHQKRQYKKLHLIFPYSIKKQSLKIFALQSNLIKYLAKHSIKQFFHTLYFTDINVFTLKISYLKHAFSTFGSGRQRQLRKKIAQRFCDIFYNIGNFHQINLYYYKSPSSLAQNIAQQMLQKINHTIAIMRKNKATIINQNADDVDVIIIDRSLDPTTPLLHNLDFQPMLMDLLKLQLQYTQPIPKIEQLKQKNKKQQIVKQYQQISQSDTKSKKTKKNKKNKHPSSAHSDSQINLKPIQLKQITIKKTPLPKGLNQLYGPIYDQYRYQFIPIVMEGIKQDAQKFKDMVDNSSIQQKGLIDMSISKQYDIVLQTAKQSNRIFNQGSIDKIALLQQSLATGTIDQTGVETQSVKILSQVRQWINNKNIDDGSKLRLALLSMCCINLSQQDFKSLIDLFPQQKTKAFTNFVWLGVNVNSKIKKSTKNIKQNIRNMAKQKFDKTHSSFNRYSSIIQRIMPIILEGLSSGITMDQSMFGCIVVNHNEKGEAKKVELRAEQRKKKRLVIQKPIKKKKMIVLFVGGASYSEVSTLRSLQKVGNYQLIIGADQILTPQNYIQQIIQMKQHI